MTHGSLFSGIGGFDLAAQWMGWENVFQVEWDKYCQKVLAKNFPETLKFGDIVEFNKMLQNGEIITNTNDTRTHRKEEYTAQERIDALSQPKRSREMGIGRCFVDVISGGFPCQPFSHAGKRKGTDDSRYLWPEMLTTIRILKPSFVVGENVAGLVSMENGKTLDRILSDLANEGYQTEQFIIPACGVGAWHRRDRIWIVAYPNTRGTQRYRAERIKTKLSSTELNSHNSKRQPNRLDNKWWTTEPSVGRVANGIPSRVDRLKGLGNAIVPQVAYQIFKAIEETNQQL